MHGAKVERGADRAITTKGDMAARIAAFDWAATPLGPMADWPPSLSTVVNLLLRSPVAMVLLWGEEGIMIYNDAYADFAGGRDGRLLGSRVREGWQEVADFNDNVMKVGLAGGTLSYKDHQLTLHRDGSPEHVWLNLDYSPVMGEDSRPAGVIAIVTETTQAHQAKAGLEQSEGKFRFLDDLAQAVTGLSDADEILAITTRMTAGHLGISNCAYADMDADENGFTIRGDWAASGSPSIVGRYVLADFGTLAVRELGAGRPLIVNDNLEELLPDEAKTFQDIGIASTICMPLIKNHRLTALMAIHDKRPRVWSAYELSIIREVTERSWAHIQRIGAERQLRDREAHNRQILDSAIDYAIIATDLDGRVERWNAGAAAILGWTEEEMVGELIDRLFTPEDRAENLPQEERDKALVEGRAGNRLWQVRKSGERFWASGEKTPLLDSEGKAIGFVKVLRDHTEDHIAQEALRASEAQLRRAEAAGGVGLFSIDIASEVITATPEFCRIFGLSIIGSVPAASIEALIIPEDAAFISDSQGRREGTAALDVEYRIRRGDTGEVRVIARRGEYERDASGIPLRLVGAVQDVTDKRETQIALQRSEAKFVALAQSMPIQVWTARVDGYLDWFNARVYAYSGANEGELDGDGWVRIVYPEDVTVAAEKWSAALAAGATYEIEFRLLNAAGEYRWHLSRALPLHDAEGRITSWVGTNTDIHAQKLAEAASARDRNRL